MEWQNSLSVATHPGQHALITNPSFSLASTAVNALTHALLILYAFRGQPFCVSRPVSAECWGWLAGLGARGGVDLLGILALGFRDLGGLGWGFGSGAGEGGCIGGGRSRLRRCLLCGRLGGGGR